MPRSFILFLLNLMVVPFVLAQGQVQNIHQRELIHSEIEQYKSRLFQEQSTLADDRYDATYYKLEVNISTSPEYLRGVVTMDAKSVQDGLTSISLDLMQAMTVDSVFVNSTKESFTQHAAAFDVTLDSTYTTGEGFEVKIFYEGVPGSSGFGSFEFSSHSGTPWVWSLSEPYGAKDWWPCKDHPKDKADSSDVFVTCSSTYKVGSNGTLMGIVDNGNGASTTHWAERYPIATYLISVTLTNFTSYSDWFHYSPTDSMQILNYILPEDLNVAKPYLSLTPAMPQIYSNLFGLYPFVKEKYGICEFGWGGGMEHQTMTSLGAFWEEGVAHELAHQWFGDMITCQSWHDIWLNEGFATYLAGLYFEHQYGTASYWNYMNGYMNEAKSAAYSVYIIDTTSVGTVFDNATVYAKGATVLHMLRHVLGDTLFFHSMYNYAHDPAYRFGSALSQNFEAVCESTSGQDLGYYFSEWLHGTSYPRYSYTWNDTLTDSGYAVTIKLSQTTGTTNPAYFTMPIDWNFTAPGWDTTITLLNNAQTQSFVVSLPREPASVQLDSSSWILKDLINPVQASPGNIRLGTVAGGSSKTDSITITNSGASPLVVSHVTSNRPQMTVTPTSGTIGAGARMKFYVKFTPTSEDTVTSNIIFSVNQGSSVHVTVGGKGLFPHSVITMAKGWNIVSVPQLLTDPRTTTIFSPAITFAYAFSQSNGYTTAESLVTGQGYWLKFAADVNVTFAGVPRSSDTIAVKSGWNLIGSLSYPLDVDAVRSIPPGNISSSFFGYKNGYHVADSLLPSLGYWLKAAQDGQIILDTSSFAKRSADRGSGSFSMMDKIIVRDAAGNTVTLYIANLPAEKNSRYDLPPLPPSGMFDVRFSDGTFAQVLNGQPSKETPILVTSASYPVTITWENKLSSMVRPSIVMKGKEIPFEGTNRITITDAESPINLRLTPMTKSQLPDHFALEQNYPNPFNPTTVINYSLPVNSFVTLTVYNMLGEEIAILVNEDQDAGVKSVQFDGSTLASGVYMIRMSAGTFTSTKRMILVR